MTRFYRLISPAIVFASLGILTFVLAEQPFLKFRGGLLATGIYLLAWQLVISGLLLAGIDDSRSRVRGATGRQSRGMLDIATRTASFRRALFRFYVRPFFPAFVLGLGVGAAVITLVAGVLDPQATLRPRVFGFAWRMSATEPVMAVLLAIGAVTLWLLTRDRITSAFAGWMFGIALAAAIGEIVFIPKTDGAPTIGGWIAYASFLCLVRLVPIFFVRQNARRSSPSPSAA